MTTHEKLGLLVLLLLPPICIGLLRWADEETRFRDLGCVGDVCLKAEVRADGIVLSPEPAQPDEHAYFSLTTGCVPGEHIAELGHPLVLKPTIASRADGLCRITIRTCHDAERNARSCAAPNEWNVYMRTFSGAVGRAFRGNQPY
jgi:hypothetical protein